MAANPEDKGSLDELKKSVESLGSPVEEILKAIGNMYDEADRLNNAFVAGRTRLDEMADAASKSAAGVIRLGGEISNVSQTISEIADGSRRSVIATEDQVSKLYAASRVLGTGVSELVQGFAEVGVETSQIGVNLEQSIEYIQSLGLNAKTVMGDVTRNMSLMNRFNFSDGVVGLTKMAAQASMLRFDMQSTASFAEKVMTPEGAIQTAAALQRLGLAVGQLGDPFALMNDSLNDPGALQDSLIKATKQFTEFDEKSKTFKINPQGILTLKQMSEETGISYDQLTKTALAAADLDKRVSAINPSLQFDSEQDKQFIANMASMSKEGEYVVKLKNDETGIVETKKLGELTQDEITKLREQQENAPKTLEEIQTSQLDVMEDIKRSVDSIVAKGTYGVAGASVVRGNITGAERITRALVGSIDKQVPESAKITEKVNEAIDKMSALFIQKDAGKLSSAEFAKQLKTLEDTVLSEANTLGDKGVQAFKNVLAESDKKITGNSGIEKEFKSFVKETLSATGTKFTEVKPKTGKEGETKYLSTSELLNRKPVNEPIQSKQITSTQPTTNTTKVDGQFKIVVETPPGTTLNQQQLNSIFNSEGFRQYIANLGKDTKGAGVAYYGG